MENIGKAKITIGGEEIDLNPARLPVMSATWIAAAFIALGKALSAHPMPLDRLTKREKNLCARLTLASRLDREPTDSEVIREAALTTRPRRSRQLRSTRPRAAKRLALRSEKRPKPSGSGETVVIGGHR